MRTFKVIEPRGEALPHMERTYEGFDRDFHGERTEDVPYVAIVVWEDEVQAWALDTPSHVSALAQFLHDNDYETARLVGVYQRIDE